MKEDLYGTVAQHRDAITVKRVFGEPYEKNGVTIIPAASVMGGGGGGYGDDPKGGGAAMGAGTGFGLAGRPAGAFVIKGDEVTWQPAIDVNRIAIGLFVVMGLRLILRRRRR